MKRGTAVLFFQCSRRYDFFPKSRGGSGFLPLSHEFLHLPVAVQDLLPRYAPPVYFFLVFRVVGLARCTQVSCEVYLDLCSRICESTHDTPFSFPPVKVPQLSFSDRTILLSERCQRAIGPRLNKFNNLSFSRVLYISSPHLLRKIRTITTPVSLPPP